MSLVPFPGSQVAAPDREPDAPDWDQSSDDLGARMSFLDHLEELRRRIMRSVIALGIGLVVSFAFVQQEFDFVMRPLHDMLPKNSMMQYTEPTEAFVLYLKIAFLSGIFLTSPYILLQAWRFVAPGLYAKEKRFAIPFILLGTIGFVSGAAFTHYILFPFMWKFLASFSSQYIMFNPKIDAVFGLYSKMLLGMGLIFQMPAVVFILARIGVVTAGFLLRHIKYAVLIIFIVAAVITPSGDMLTQTLFAAPMLGLYVLSIGIAWLAGRARRRQKAVEASAD